VSVFKQNSKSHIKRNMFLDNGVDISRFDIQKYPSFDSLTEKQLGFFWQPSEVDLTRDSSDFKSLQPHEQHIFTSNLKRQILLDSVQGRSPLLALLPIVSLPELETWIITWSFFETIHSRSYTHIIRNIYPDPSVVFDNMMDIKEIIDCSADVSKYYDDILHYNREYIDTDNNAIMYDYKKALWKCLVAVNALEGVRFYVSFACSWAFAELKKMEGNAKIIKFIARDENLHLASTQQMLKLLPKEDADFEKIKTETKEECINLYKSVVDQEKAWAKFLFKDGSIIGLNEEILNDYIEWIANKRMQSIGLDSPYKGGTNPLLWTQKWISGSDVQVAPQEVEISSYTIGGINKDVEKGSLKGFKL
jgi:ribonucleoside-diphosphate reductase beta chain